MKNVHRNSKVRVRGELIILRLRELDKHSTMQRTMTLWVRSDTWTGSDVDQSTSTAFKFSLETWAWILADFWNMTLKNWSGSMTLMAMKQSRSRIFDASWNPKEITILVMSTLKKLKKSSKRWSVRCFNATCEHSVARETGLVRCSRTTCFIVWRPMTCLNKSVNLLMQLSYESSSNRRKDLCQMLTWTSSSTGSIETEMES